VILPRRRSLISRLREPLDDLGNLLFEEGASAVLVTDRDGRVVRGNSRVGAMLGGPPEGMFASMLFSPADRPGMETALTACLRGDRLLVQLRVRLAVGAGVVAVAAAPVREADGTVSGLIVRLADLEAEQRLEAHLAHGQKLQAVGQLAGGIAHDFNNLLTAIIGAADCVLERHGVDIESLADIRHVRLAAERGAALVRQLLAFGQRQPLQPRVISVNTAISGLAGLLRRVLGEKVRLELELEEPGRLVRADPTQLDQVLINLAVNARDAMETGGVLTLHSGHRAVYRPETHGPETIPIGRYVLIEVTDTGRGIPADVLPRIFEPFFTTRPHNGGSGLGLSTVLGIVRQSNGFLTVDSVVGQGTAMRIYLPRYDGDEAPAPAPASEIAAAAIGQAAVATPGRVRGILLLVEDDQAVRHLAERALRRAGWQVTVADSAETALDTLPGLAGGLDVLVSDVVMPGMEGPVLVREIRKIWPGLPVVLVSGYAESAVRGDLPSERVIFLPKPYSLAELLSAYLTFAVVRGYS
jgi:two-component system cell cycle sensor histidine kinase/response regulator CckA